MFGRHPAILSASGSSASFMRALQPAAWFRADTGVTVTGQGVSTLADQSGNGRDLLQSTDASRPPYLSYTGTKYLYLPGVDSNSASTPDAAGSSAGTGAGNDFEAYGRFKLNDWTPATNTFANKHAVAAPNFSWDWYIGVGGAPIFRISLDGTALITNTATSAVSFTDGATGWLKVTRAQASGDVIFYTAPDSATVPTSWTKLGNTVSSTAGAIFDGNGALRIGASNASALTVNGACYRFVLLNGIGGSVAADFNPDLDGADQAATITSSATGEVWTINKSGGLPAQIVGRPSLLFDGSADYLKTNAFTLNQPETVYIAFKQVSWSISDTFTDGNSATTMYIYQGATSPKIRMNAGTNTDENSNLPVGQYAVISAVFNGASSVLQVNQTATTGGNCGAANAGGFTLGGTAIGTACTNIQVLEAIIFPTAHDASQRARVIQYLAGRHGIAL